MIDILQLRSLKPLSLMRSLKPLSLTEDGYAHLIEAEAQRPLLPFQYVARLAVRRFLDQPKATLLRAAGDEQR